jgi:predicted tellurium resistance membrane protein TerC
MDLITDPQIWLALVTLTTMEIVLGIDNIVFISILCGRLPAHDQPRARFVGLALAMGMRVLLLLSITWIMKLTEPLFHLFEHGFSGRDLILLCGGLFLIGKATTEIHHKLEDQEEAAAKAGAAAGFASIIAQIVVLDIVFSLDSVITAVGMAKELGVMIAAVVIAVLFMMVFAKAIGDFIHRHPTVKMLALSFLLLIGVVLVADGLGRHIAKGYIYFAMAFSVMVEVLNLKLHQKSAKPQPAGGHASLP